MRRVSILYFARMRETIGVDGEEVDLPDAVNDVAALADWLSERSPRHEVAFADKSRIRCAIDQQMARFDVAINDAQEIAFFPPVTGG